MIILAWSFVILIRIVFNLIENPFVESLSPYGESLSSWPDKILMILQVSKLAYFSEVKTQYILSMNIKSQMQIDTDILKST